MKQSTPRFSLLILLALAGALLGARAFLVFGAGEPELLRYAGQTAVVAGTVAADPDRRERSIRAVVSVERISGERAEGRVLAVLPREEEVYYGDYVEVRGALEEPEPFETDAGRTFDYKTYLRVRGVSLLMPFAELQAHDEGGPHLLRALFALKHRFERSLERLLQEPYSALLQGILLGERGGFPRGLLDVFVVVGLIHIVVLSGSNISIVAEGVFRALGFLPRTLTFVLGGASISLFVLMTGSGAAAVRALIMAAIALLARYLRRPELALRALVVAAYAMVVWNPLYLLEQGFVLSVLATFGLITLSPAVETRLSAVPAFKHFNLRSIIASTLAVEAFLLPALLYYSGVLSLVALPVNVLVLPWLWLLMLLGFLAGLLGLLHPYLALVPALLSEALLRALLVVAEAGAALPFAHTTVAPFPAWVVLAVYAVLIVLALRTYARSPAN